MGRQGRPERVSHEAEAIPGLDELADSLLVLRTRDECRRFLRDLCTFAELEALAQRWRIAGLLDERRPYLEVAGRAHASTTTVTRVAHWLHHGTGGYRIVLDRTRGQAKAG
ncbi:MAG: YerC/YecD family TrpR-related protein [Solirubrobacterales bacterium]